MAVTMLRNTIRLSEDEIRVRIDQGMTLAQYTKGERTWKARTYGISSSGYISNLVATGTMFGRGLSMEGEQVMTLFGKPVVDSNGKPTGEIDHSQYDPKLAYQLTWSVMVALAQAKKPWSIRVKLTELVLAYVDADVRHVKEPFCFPPDAKAIYTILLHPNIYQRDIDILVAKLYQEHGANLTDEEAALVTLPTPDLYKRVKSHMDTTSAVPTDEIENKLDEIKSAVEALDENITELEFSAPAQEEQEDRLTPFIEEARAFFATFKGNADVLIGQQATIDALRETLTQKETELARAYARIAELEERDAERTAKLLNIVTAVGFVNEALAPTEAVVESEQEL